MLECASFGGPGTSKWGNCQLELSGGIFRVIQTLLTNLFKAKAALLVAFALSFGLSALYAATPDDAYNPKIAAVKVEGNKNVAAILIYGHIQEKEGDVFSLRRVQEDIHSLFSMGNFKDVKVDAEPATKPGLVVLTFKVEERPLVGEILFKGNKKWDAKKLEEDMKTASKVAFDQAKLNEDLEGIRKKYHDEGYSYVEVTGEGKLDPAKNVVDVSINVAEGNKIKVGGVTVIGAQAFSAKKVADQLKDNRKGEKYKPDSLADDMKAVEDFYHNEGYLRAVVLEHQESLDDTRKKVFITMTVKEGQQFTTGKISFKGNVQFDDEDLSKALGLKKGDILRKKDMDDGLRRMKSLYADKGYIYSSLNPATDYDEDLKKADISFQVIEGQVAFVQDVKIVGNYKTRDYVIRRELDIHAGDKFEASKIRSSAQNLYNLGYFEDVNPEVEPGDVPGKEVLVFRIKERRTGSISVGGGYSSVQGLVGNVKLEEANLFGKGQHVTLDLEFGLYQSINIGFTEPWLFNTRTSLGVNLFDSTRVFLSSVPNTSDNTTNFYTQSQIGGSISIGRRLSRYWSVFGAYSLQNVQISNVDSYYTTIGTPQFIQATNSTTSSFTPRIVYDSRDNYFEPTTGWKHQLSIEFAGGPLQFDNNFIKAIEDTSHFIPLPAGFVFGEHVRLGVGQGYSFPGKAYTDIPLYEKFFAGGTDTIRGYNERSVGPLQGGNALFVSNTELKHEIAGPLRGVLFFDMGDGWTSIWNTGENHLQFGAGLGLRLTIPGTIMAVRLDYGWPIASDLPVAAAPPGGVLHFNLGDLF